MALDAHDFPAFGPAPIVRHQKLTERRRLQNRKKVPLYP
jgi:hypothetical protein